MRSEERKLNIEKRNMLSDGHILKQASAGKQTAKQRFKHAGP